MLISAAAEKAADATSEAAWVSLCLLLLELPFGVLQRIIEKIDWKLKRSINDLDIKKN